MGFLTARPSRATNEGVRAPIHAAFWLVVLTAAPMAAEAGDSDFRLNAGTGSGAGRRGILFDETYKPRNDLFRDFATQLGFVLAPRNASPAETLGHAGFHLGAMWSGSFVSNDQSYWQVSDRAQAGRDTAGVLHTLQLDVRKGLPFSFELGVNLMWLWDSAIFAPGLEVRWALQEGFKYAPDFSVRGSVNHMVGNRDLLLTTIGLDAMLSKSFGLFGMINLCPYIGWSLIMVAATSRVIDPTPTDEKDIENNFVFDEINATDRINHKLTFGLRTLVYVLNVSVQGELQMLSKYDTGGSGIATITTKLGLDF